MCAFVAASMLFTSCHDPYDDTALRNEIADLWQKVQALEDRLNEEVSALTDLIAAVDAKTVVASATQKEDGSWEIILSSGQIITVHPKYVPTPQEPEKNEGCITVIKEGDAYYWAIITNGTPVAITDANGKMVPVTHNAQPLVTVDNVTGEVKVSFDGGASWVVVEKAAEKEEEKPAEPAAPSCIFVGVTDGKESVDFTLADGSVISLPKAEEIDFGVKAGKTFVTPGESATVALTAVNIDDLTVIAKPEGWKASIAGTTLTITAPSQEAIDGGSAELEGVIKIHAAGGDGKCKVGKVVVSASSNSLVLSVAGDVLTIYNNVMTESAWYGPQLAVAYYGIAEEENFSADAIAKGLNDYTLESFQCYDTMETVSIKSMYNQYVLHNYGDESTYVEIPAGKSYVIWAISGSNDWSHVYTGDEVIYTMFTPPFLTFTKGEVTFNTAEFSVKAGGYDSYMYGTLKASSIDEAKAQLEWSLADWIDGWGTFGEVTTDMNFSGSVMDFGYMGWDYNVCPSSTYVAFVLPILNDKPTSTYTMDDIKFFEITTEALQPGGSATLSFVTNELTYTYVDVTINGSSNTTMIYAAPLYESDLLTYTTDEAILEYVIAYCTEYGQIQNGNVASAYISSLTPGESAYVAAIAVDEQGKYSALYKEKFTTKNVAFNETLKVKIDEQASKVDISSALIKVSTEGGVAAAYRYIATELDGYYWRNLGSLEAAEGKMALETSYYIQEVSADALVDGCISLTGLETGAEHIIAVLAIDADGNPSRATSYTFTPNLPEYPLIRATNSAYAAMKPAYTKTVVWNGDYGCFDVHCDVTPVAGTEKYWVAALGEEYLSAESAARDAVNYLLLKDGQYYGSKSYTSAASYKGTYIYDVNANLWITWLDAQGNYYECVREPLFTWNYVLNTAAEWTASEPAVTVEKNGGVVSFTVTPGAGASKVYIYPRQGQLYYDESTLTYMMTLNPECITTDAAYSGTITIADDVPHVYVAWSDAAGNLYQVKDVTVE